MTAAKAEMARGASRKSWLRTVIAIMFKAIAASMKRQDFNSAAPNQIWAGDIFYVATSEVWLFLAVIIAQKTIETS